jgi:hypothetical protein
MKQLAATWAIAIAALGWPGALTAHHSLVQFDTTAPVWVKGTVVRFDPITPHARFLLDERRQDGRTQRWVVDGPPSNNLTRMGIGPDFLTPGDVIEVCGFVLKDEVAAQRSSAPGASDASMPSGRPLSGHLLVMPNGKRRYWTDYGVLDKRLTPGEDKEALRREAFGR